MGRCDRRVANVSESGGADRTGREHVDDCFTTTRTSSISSSICWIQSVLHSNTKRGLAAASALGSCLGWRRRNVGELSLTDNRPQRHPYSNQLQQSLRGRTNPRAVLCYLQPGHCVPYTLGTDLSAYWHALVYATQPPPYSDLGHTSRTAKLEGRWKRGVHSVPKRRGGLVTSHARGPIFRLCSANLFDSRFRLRRPASQAPCFPASQSGFKVCTAGLIVERSAWRLNLDHTPLCLVRPLKEASAALEHGDLEPNFMRCYLCTDG